MVKKISNSRKAQNIKSKILLVSFFPSKKAQMKIQQTAIILLAITLLFVLVALFFLSFKIQNLKKDANLASEKDAIILSSKLSESPEFSCQQAFGNKRVNCIDSDKLMALIENSDKYSNFFGVSNIEVIKIQDKEELLTKCTDANYPNCNHFSVFDSNNSGFSYTSFVSLCRKVNYQDIYFYDKCELSKLIISYEKIS
ncbi:MAG: hypothetical protein WC812_04670 [Candidatus Pacearchaeota archaeon]|jgi:hypothetical protein